MAELMTGKGQSVDAQNDADLYAGIIGNGVCVLETGSGMAYKIINNTVVRIMDGIALKEGRAIIIPNGSYDDFEIPQASGVTFEGRYIGYRIYAGDNGKELIEPVVSNEMLKTSGLRAGASQMYVWLYEVTYSFMGIEAVEPLYNQVLSKSSIGEYFSIVKADKIELSAGIENAAVYSSITLPAGRYLIFAQAAFSSVANSTGQIGITLTIRDASSDICRARYIHCTANSQVIQTSAPIVLKEEKIIDLKLSSTTKRTAGGAWIKAMRVG